MNETVTTILKTPGVGGSHCTRPGAVSFEVEGEVQEEHHGPDAEKIDVSANRRRRRWAYVRRKFYRTSRAVPTLRQVVRKSALKAFGLWTYHALEAALYHAVDAAPGLVSTHRFCCGD